MTEDELKKYTVDFMNNETGLNKSNLNSVMGKMLIRYAEIFQKQIKALQKQNRELTDSIRDLENVVLDLLDNTDESTRLKALNCVYRQKEIKEND